jgi:alkylation response protein AidB-like acyl-CoA dehydrogenase
MLYTKEQRNLIEMFLPDAPRYNAMLAAWADFFEKELLPMAKKLDQEVIFSHDNFAKLAGQKIMAIPVPERYNGLGLPFPVYIAALEMLAKACGNTALQVSVQGMILEGILLFGSERQKDYFLKEKGLAEGTSLAAFALTEPCCGTDAKAIQAQAVLSGENYTLNGTKTWITNGGEAEIILVFAKTEKGISAFLVPRKTEGYKVLKIVPKLGFKGSRLAVIQLENCRVHQDNLLGEEGQGFEYAKQILNCGRLTIAAIGVGIAQAAYEKSLSYSTKRSAFGESIAHFQLVKEKLADMATEINAARLLTFYAAYLKNTGRKFVSEASQAKLFASEMALRICDKAIQLHGAQGYIDAFDVHRHWRDARLLSIGEGTSDILRLLIANLSLKEISHT